MKTSMMRLKNTRSVSLLRASLHAVCAFAIASLVDCDSKPATTIDDVEAKGSPAVTLTAIEFDQKVIAEGLNTPAGLAVQPESGDVFVSTIDGVMRLSAENDFSMNPEIIGFATDSYGKGPSYSFGPLGLGFLDSQTPVSYTHLTLPTIYSV